LQEALVRGAFKVIIGSTVLVLFMHALSSAFAQPAPNSPPFLDETHQAAISEETANILGLSPLLDQLRALRSQRECGSAETLEELRLRQTLLEAVEAASLDVDGVLAEIVNERTDLSELRSSLEIRRDHAIGLTNTVNLITGTGLGIAVNALQFKDSTALIGDGLGVGSGIASTVLSLVSIRQQRGPHQGIGAVPNMLAPLFNEEPALNTYYPPEVLRYLQSETPGQDPRLGSRLAQLMDSWSRAGRFDALSPIKRQQKITKLTASSSKTVKLSIDDLTDRSAMLGDISGRVSLLKRDLATLMRSLRSSDAGYKSEPQGIR
jgi:hypothetical protein